MELAYHKTFRRKYKKCSRQVRDKCKERITLFLHDPFDPALHNHPLHGKFKDCFSINITGDIRVIYIKKGSLIIFLDIDTHSKLY